MKYFENFVGKRHETLESKIYSLIQPKIPRAPCLMSSDSDIYTSLRLKLMANLHTATNLARNQGLALLAKYPKALLIEKDFTFKRSKEVRKEPHGI